MIRHVGVTSAVAALLLLAPACILDDDDGAGPPIAPTKTPGEPAPTEAPTDTPEPARATATPTATATPGETPPPAPTATPSPPPAGEAAFHPDDTRTGNEAVDRALDAIVTGDREAIVDLVTFTPVACENAGGIGSLPCPDGVAEGTELDVLPVAYCEGGFVSSGYFEEWVTAAGTWLVSGDARLHAVFEREGDGLYSGDYRIVLGFPAGTAVRAVDVAAGGGIVSLFVGCQHTLDTFAFPEDDGAFLVPPP